MISQKNCIAVWRNSRLRIVGGALQSKTSISHGSPRLFFINSNGIITDNFVGFEPGDEEWIEEQTIKILGDESVKVDRLCTVFQGDRELQWRSSTTGNRLTPSHFISINCHIHFGYQFSNRLIGELVRSNRKRFKVGDRQNGREVAR